MTRTVLPVALALAAICGAAQAQPASYPPGVVAQTVRFGDLDPSTASGAKHLAFRIRVAARSVCGGEIPVIRSSTGFQVCVNDSIERAAAKLDNPMVTAALHVPTAAAYAGR